MLGKIVILMLGSLAALFTASLYAQVNAPDLKKEQQALITAREQSQRADERATALRRQSETADSEADRLASEAAALAARIQAAEADIRAAQARIAIVERLQQRQQTRLAERQEPVVRLTAALQAMTRKPTALTLVEPRSLDELIYIRSIMSAILPEIRKRTSDLRAELTRARELRVQANQAVVSLRDSKIQLASRTKELANLEANQRLAARRFARDAGLEQERALALGEEARDILELMDQIRESGAVRASLAVLDGPVLRPRQGRDRPLPDIAQDTDISSAYRLPADGELVIGLGEVSDSGYRSRGLTLTVSAGAQIVAPASGRVAFSGPYRGYGNILIIEHDPAWTSLITNLASVTVEVGDNITQGAPIGKAGQNEPNVTVELRRKGRPIDIAALIG